ncbi:MAG: hypothetical protein WCK01_03010 [Candidatus Uhrbacteria bacterium]
MDDQAQPDLSAPQPEPANPAPAQPDIHFGEILDLGNHQYWTISSTDGGVIVTKKGQPDRKLSQKELSAALTRKIPIAVRHQGDEFSTAGIALGQVIHLPEDIGANARIVSFDATSNGGEVQIVIPNKGTFWVPKTAIQDIRLVGRDANKGLDTLREAVGVAKDEPKEKARQKKEKLDKTLKPEELEKRARIETAVKEAEKEAAKGGVVGQSDFEDAMAHFRGITPEQARAEKAKKIREKVEKQIGEQQTSTVKKEASIAVPAMQSAQEIEESLAVEIPTINEVETEEEQEVTIQAKASSPAPVAAAAASVVISQTIPVGKASASSSSSSVKISATVPVGGGESEPSIREVRAQLTAQRAEPVLSQEQKAISAQLVSVLNNSKGDEALKYIDQQLIPEPVMRSRPVQQAAAASATRAMSSGAVQQGAAIMKKFNLPKEEVDSAARSAFRTNIMKGSSEGVEQLTNEFGPPDQYFSPPQLENLRAAGMVASGASPKSSPRGATSAKPSTRSSAGGGSVAVSKTIMVGATPVRSRATNTTGKSSSSSSSSQSSSEGSLMAGGVRQQLKPQLELANAVAFHTQSSPTQGGFVEGVGSASAGQLSEDSSNPVFGSEVHDFGSQASPEEQDQENDVYRPGGASNERFRKQQEQASATGQQFLPDSTGLPSTEFENKEKNRQMESRPTEAQDFGGGNAGLAAAFMMQQAAAQQQQKKKGEEEDDSSMEDLQAQTEAVKRMISRGTDAFNASMSIATAETVIGAILELAALMLNMNMRLLALKLKKNGLLRKIFPAAQYPFEAVTIIIADILVPMCIFLGICLMIGMMFMPLAIVAVPALGITLLAS